jgi:hypothetical protein
MNEFSQWKNEALAQKISQNECFFIVKSPSQKSGFLPLVFIPSIIQAHNHYRLLFGKNKGNKGRPDVAESMENALLKNSVVK